VCQLGYEMRLRQHVRVAVGELQPVALRWGARRISKKQELYASVDPSSGEQASGPAAVSRIAPHGHIGLVEFGGAYPDGPGLPGTVRPVRTPLGNTGHAAVTWLSCGSGSDRIDRGGDLFADGVPATGVGRRYGRH